MENMEFTAEMIAEFLGGEVVGDKDIKANNVAKIEEAKGGDLAFLANLKYEHFIYSTSASIVIVDRDFVAKDTIKATLIKVDSAYQAFSNLLDMYVAAKPQKRGISPKSSVAEDVVMGEDCYLGDFVVLDSGVKLGDNVKIYPNCYISNNVKIGNNSIIYAGVNIYEDCVIGDNVIIHSGAVIGADGFGFAPNSEGVFKKIHQIGNVVIEDNVEVGSNTTIDRATMGSTIIKKGCKLDNLIQIGHNVVVGENSVAAAQVGIAGSTKVGRNCMFGGQVGIAGHISIADFTQVGSQSGIPNSVKEPNTQILGTPATKARKIARVYALQMKLPEIYKELNDLKKEVELLRENK